MKLIYTGAQGTGKSTMLRLTPIDNKITEVVRQMAKQGVKINRDGDEESQKSIFNAYMGLLNQDGEWVSDRGLTDVLAYTMYLYANNPGLDLGDIMAEQLRELRNYNREHQDVIYVYFPIEFPVVGDGVRDTDEVYRSTIDRYIKDLLIMSNAHFITITGDVKNREETIRNLLGR